MIKKFRLWIRCEHVHVRCVHGDEIVQRGFARVLCLDCGRALKHRPLPEPCTVTGHRHHRAIHIEGDR